MVYWSFQNFFVSLTLTKASADKESLFVFSATNYNTVEKRIYSARIKPGYILMQEADYLDKNYNTGTMHSKLLRDFTGKDLVWVGLVQIFRVNT